MSRPAGVTPRTVPDATVAGRGGGHGGPGTALLLAVAVGGAVGSIARAALTDAVAADHGTWPWATFAVNVAGAFLLGIVVTALGGRDRRSVGGRMLLGTGLCGGLTTFSTLQLEVLEMLDDDRIGLAAGYVGVSVAVGLLAAAAGVVAGRRIAVRPPAGAGRGPVA
ncbi:MAG: fluoride efflux transporter CrcB [Solirubrobacteraceae bacterium]|nr:fluoride efflux transporter CrcB [Solirubrobacteraceae bacterium]